MKRLIAMMLVLILCLAALPLGAMAAEEEEPAAEETEAVTEEFAEEAAEPAEEEPTEAVGPMEEEPVENASPTEWESEKTAEPTEELFVEVAELTEEEPADETGDPEAEDAGEEYPVAEEPALEAAVEEEFDAPVTDGEAGDVFSTLEEAAAYIREQMVARNTSFTLVYDFKQTFTIDTVAAYVEPTVESMVEAAMAHTGVSDEGDYLRWQYESYSYGFGYSYDKSTGRLDGTTLTLDFTFSYYTTAQQEAQVTSRIDSILASLNLDGKSDYEKVRAIYDWICQNVAYDWDNLYNDNYNLKYTAYAALFNGKAVCQGFSNLFYRMLLECGIDNRVVAGICTAPNTDIGEMNHTWNIVKLDGLYYETDVTWDINFTNSYRYFLRGGSDFSADHMRFEEYTTSFSVAYPIAPEAYVIPAAGSGTASGISGSTSSGGTTGSSSGGSTTSNASGGTAGDIDGNSSVNISDVQLLLKFVNGQNVSAGADACDIDNNGSVNISDVQLLLKFVNGQNVTIY